MENIKEVSRIQNNANSTERTNYAPSTQSAVLDPTSQSKVSPRIEIKLGRKQLYETQWLFTQYGLSKPTWLRGKFLLNQYRRKCLNDNFREAQLDQAFCGKCSNYEDWAGLLHGVWHDINRSPSCK